ncbi:MAG: hypothetical protein HQ567_30735, partial [Candidatus Nealsonbacteria bacterium]|nr:hypothetical protein [Candidatus Nealsonbacteria bacterium]
MPVVEFFDVTETSVTLTEPLDDGTYYIGVTAVGPNQTPQVDAGPDVTIGPGQWLVGSGLFTDPDHRVEATNNRLSFEVASAPEPYHRVFVTSLRFSIDPSQSFPPSAGVSFGGMQAADWQVTLSAFYGGLLSNWDGYAIVYQAILSTSTVAARDRNAVHGPVYNLAGELVAASASQLWSDDLQNPVGYDEWGAGPVPTLTEPWTGTFADGTHSGNSCSAWSTQFDTGTVGDASRTASNWLNADIQGCDRKARLYAISPLLGVAPTVDAGGDAAGVQGEAFTRSGSFADRGDVFWTATVDYGDGAAPQSLPLDFEAHAFQLDHTYTTPGTYPVTVTINDSDPSTDAAVTTFEVDVQQAGPGPFTITGPVGQIVIEYATVTWEASAGATSYELVVSQSSDLSSPVQEYFDLTGTSQVLDALNNGTYYVGVTAANDDALTTDATNNGFSFTVAVSFPAPFSITGPVSPVQTETPTVSWEASANATGYDMIVATDMACTAPIATYEDLVVTSQLLDPMVNGTYYVCVTAFDNYNHEVAATNSGFAFNVLVQPPGAFLITAPSAPVNAQSATIAWEVAERAIEYDLAVSTASDCSAALENYNGLTVTTQTTGTLANGTYYACVTARDADGRTSVATNNGFSFEIAYVPPKEHRIFVTSVETTIDQNESFPPPYPGWGGLAAADWTCTYHAYLGGYLPNWDGLQVVYHAVLSTTAETAHDSLQIEGPILNTAGQTVADSAAEFWSGTLQNGITYDETGAAAPANSLVWTGTLNDGSYGGNSCGAWNDVNFNGLVGLSDETSLGWTSSHTQPCTASARLYCLSPKESKGSGAFVPAVTGGRKSEATTTPDRFDLTASALQLVDAAGEPV